MPFLRNNFKCEKSFPISLAAAVRNVEECAWNRKLSANAWRNLDLKQKPQKKQNKKQSAQNKERKHYFDINSNRVAEAKSVINIRNS